MIEIISTGTDPSIPADIAIVRGRATVDDAQTYALKLESHTLVLNTFQGWDGDLEAAIEAFAALPVRKLSVFGNANIDVTALSRWSSLVELQVAGLVHGHLSLNDFPLLRSFGFGAEIKGKSKLALDWGMPGHLQRIITAGSKLPPLQVLATFPALSALSVVKPAFAPEELSDLKGLADLDVSYWQSLKSFSQLQWANQKLQRLSLLAPSKLADYTGIGDLESLEYLHLRKSPSLPSVSLLAALKSLRTLHLIETKVVDGDLSPLLSLPRLEEIGLADYRHYVPSRDDIVNTIESRRAACP